MRPAVLITIVLVVLTTVVIALPLMMSKPDDFNTDSQSAAQAQPLGAVGIQYALLDKQFPVITQVIEDSPAALAGIEKDDLLLSVNHEDASMIGEYEINAGLNGAPDSAVQITVKAKNGDIMERNILRNNVSDFPKNAAQELIKQSKLTRQDYLLRRDAMAGDNDLAYTSLIMQKLHQGPVVVEFFDSSKGADKNLQTAINAANKIAMAKSGDKGQSGKLITHISLDLQDGSSSDLAAHFKVIDAPVVAFIPGNRGIILERNVIRGPMSKSQVDSEIGDLLYASKQPIPQILTSPSVNGPELEEQNKTYTPLNKSQK